MSLRPSLAEAPEGWEGSKPEWIFYASLIELGYQPGSDFSYQSPLMGGRLDKGGIIIDFMFNNPPDLAVMFKVYTITMNWVPRQRHGIYLPDSLWQVWG